jgi:hypothetical protein
MHKPRITEETLTKFIGAGTLLLPGQNGTGPMKRKKQKRANRAVLPAAVRARFFVSTFLAREPGPVAGSGRVTGNL